MILKLSSPIYALPDQFSLITQRFGGNGEWYRKNGIDITGHNGLDILAWDGQPVYAAHDGIVLRTETDARGGVGVRLRTTTKYDYKDTEIFYETLYWHLQKYIVAEGQEVRAKDVIAFADNTGFSTGPHTHFGLKPLKDDFTLLEPDNGYYGAIDPLPFLFQNDMEHIIIGLNQYLLYKPLKIAIGIARPEELQKLRDRGLTSQPAPADSSILNGYWVIPGYATDQLRDIFNL